MPLSLDLCSQCITEIRKFYRRFFPVSAVTILLKLYHLSQPVQCSGHHLLCFLSAPTHSAHSSLSDLFRDTLDHVIPLFMTLFWLPIVPSRKSKIPNQQAFFLLFCCFSPSSPLETPQSLLLSEMLHLVPSPKGICNCAPHYWNTPLFILLISSPLLNLS